jgi:hypothetical protein
MGLRVEQVYQKANRAGLKKSAAFLASPAAHRLDGVIGAATRFKPGQSSWNKGVSYQAGGRSPETRFKPGTLNGKAQTLYQPVGTYRINGDGYLDRKISDDALPHKRWVAVHRLVWIAAHGEIPPGHVIVFLPGRKTTDLEQITADALECISRRDLVARNTIHRYPPELQQVIRVAAKLRRRIDDHANH